MFENLNPLWIYYVCAIGAALAALDAIYNLTFRSADHRGQINRRLKVIEQSDSRERAIAKLRRERSLTRDGGFVLPIKSLNRLIVQSGLTRPLWQVATGIATLACVAFATGWLWRGSAGGIVACLFAGFAMPVLALIRMRSRRRAKFTDQFAEAIDVIVRSLRAGHPVPVAIKMAAREMPDPIGSEFGMVEDEVTYGLDLESAVRHLQDRVGQEDLPLFIASVAIQMSSGGNLTEILEGLSDVVRLRAKMRRKVRALSAEGRMSALILSATPILLFLIVNWMTPDFYGKTWDHPWMSTGLSIAGIWMLIGNLIMHCMIRFRI